MSDMTIKAPRHLWIVGILAVLWNAMGAFDYSASQLKLDFYMQAFTPEQLEYFYGFPAWAVAAWAIAVWSALAASVGLLLRKRWSVVLFGVSIAAMVITGFYNFVLTDGAALMGQGAIAFTAVIWIVAFFLFFYARALSKRGVLN
jgi:hypothetical protein